MVTVLCWPSVVHIYGGMGVPMYIHGGMGVPMYIQRHGGAKVHMHTRYLVLECSTVYYKVKKKRFALFF